MNIAQKERLHQQLRQKYDEKVKIYLEKFGEHSLDNVFLWEPHDYPIYWKNCLESAIGDLQKAIDSDVPIEPDPENVIY
ncbi:TPA: hypothetical protein U1629_000838 [Streptococcus suis]|nr:hypothetical protein [Streptococcus suis]NQO21505.1 hypothetical protein [Streptococcus suis]NQP14915.1 hypothetical protein [Streptococcus suis]HEM5120722.1 hypothetical protein [Streptococcus suis]HEM5175846.1 hypothetical protein [Streptococcus suis]